jgi:hypothetical protein
VAGAAASRREYQRKPALQAARRFRYGDLVAGARGSGSAAVAVESTTSSFRTF